MSSELLAIDNLHVEYRTDDEIIKAVNGIDIRVNKKETLGLVGETGAGKTTTALSILKLLPQGVGFITDGRIMFGGQELSAFKEAKMRSIRGNRISMIFQDPMTSLNPILTVGEQIYEAIWLHNKLSKKEINSKVDRILELVDIPRSRRDEFPHQFSGGMKQRVVIAIALACEPELLIADEPTTALDVTIQAQVLAMMNDLKNKFETSMILITHDLGIIAEICDSVAIMYAGEIVEYGPIEAIFDEGLNHHPYTTGLFNSIVDLEGDVHRLKPIPGLMPDPADLPGGCKFHPRCPVKMSICESTSPAAAVNLKHRINCLHYSGGEKG